MRYHKTNSAAIQRNPRPLSRTQTGFSLLELLISMAITVIAVIAAVGLMTKFARTVGAFTEVSTMEEARGTSETLLRADFDGAGHNLTRPSPPLAGTIFATLTSFDFYTWSNGTITKTGATGWDNPANITHALASGLGSFSFTPPATGGSAYINGPSQRVAKLYRVRNNVPAPLWTSNAPVPSYPIAFGLNVYSQNQSFTNVKITGAPLIALTGKATEFAPLPYDINTQLTAPITTTGGGSGVAVLSGDHTTDAVTTVADFNQSSTDIVARAPQRGSFNKGDYVLIIDWGSLDPSSPGGAASSLCMISSVSSTTDKITLSI